MVWWCDAGCVSLFSRGGVPDDVVVGSELLHQKICGLERVVVLAREDVEVGGVGLVGEVRADVRGFNELKHRISSDFFVFAKVDHVTFFEALHFDMLTKRDGELVDCIRAADDIGAAEVEVDPSGEAPSA